MWISSMNVIMSVIKQNIGLHVKTVMFLILVQNESSGSIHMMKTN